MNQKSRALLFALFLGAVLFLGLLFAPFVLANIVSPVAMTVWLFLRVFILSIGQKYYWGALILLGVYLIARRLNRTAEVVENEEGPVPSAAFVSATIWRTSIRQAVDDRSERSSLRRDLVQLVVSTVSSRQQENTYREVFEPLKQGQIPLPDPVYAFLFPKESEESGPPLVRRLRALRQAPREWARRLSGQEAADTYQSIDQVLTFMETTLEMNDDDDEPFENGNY